MTMPTEAELAKARLRILVAMLAGAMAIQTLVIIGAFAILVRAVRH